MQRPYRPVMHKPAGGFLKVGGPSAASEHTPGVARERGLLSKSATGEDEHGHASAARFQLVPEAQSRSAGRSLPIGEDLRLKRLEVTPPDPRRLRSTGHIPASKRQRMGHVAPLELQDDVLARL